MSRFSLLLFLCLLFLVVHVSAKTARPKCRRRGAHCSRFHKCCRNLRCRKTSKKTSRCAPKFVKFDPPYANCSEKFTFPLRRFHTTEEYEEFYKPCESLISGFSGLVYTPFCLTDCHGRSKKPLRYMRDATFAVGVGVSAECIWEAFRFIFPFSNGKIPYCKHLKPGQAPVTKFSKKALRVLSHCSGKHITSGAYQPLKADPSKADKETCVVAD